jgi:ApaG protein
LHEAHEKAMSTPEMSDATTRGIRVGATAFFLPEESDTQIGRYVFGYRVVIVNQSQEKVQLLSRHWVIIDGYGHREEVRGPGVVGQTPVLEPGQGFKYTSCCPLATEWGSMEGTYQMRREDGEVFDASIARFFLTRQAVASSEPA